MDPRLYYIYIMVCMVMSNLQWMMVVIQQVLRTHAIVRTPVEVDLHGTVQFPQVRAPNVHTIVNTHACCDKK